MASSNTARLERKARKLNSEIERLEPLRDKLWMLSEDEIESIVPGDESRLASLLDAPFDNPLLPRDDRDIENPHVHLLRLMRNPDYFPFTCERIFNISLLPIQQVVLKNLWYHQFPMLIGSRGFGKSFIIALYTMLKSLICQGTKVVIVGSGFRQAKVVFEYVEMIWANAPVLRDVCGSGKGRNNRDQGPRRDIDRCECIIGNSIIIALPLGDGKKIRGQRANIIVSDEFASIDPEIYETVIKGFGAVSQDPVGNVKESARIRVLKKLGHWTTEMDDVGKVRGSGNQSIISGTASYAFNWFAKYWERYKAIIESRGNEEKLMALSPDGILDPYLDWRDYCVIRIPVKLIPDGFMDKKTIASSRAMSNSGIHMMEYSAIFINDSDGFFKRSLIEACVAGPRNPNIDYRFAASIKGERKIQHVMGVDPAAEKDNFAIVILAIWPDHRRVVYCWTVRKKEFEHRQKVGLTKEQTFYAFVARKIRELKKVFDCDHISMDAQGGGAMVAEALHDTDKMLPGEQAIWETIDEDPKKRKDSDGKKGEHILELIQFAKADWVSAANHGLKKDLEARDILFPYLDAPLLGLSIEMDKKEGKIYDTLDDAAMEIEELKDELANIVHGQTDTGREKWDVPKVKGDAQNEKRGRLRKDRYSALLMANMAARQASRAPRRLETQAVGGWAKDLAGRDSEEGQMYILGEKWRTTPDGYIGGVAIKDARKD